MGESLRLRLLVTVKAYPSISTKYNELVCCAGVTPEHQWVRLYPVPYRDLPTHRQFRKYDVIEVTCERRPDHKDNRPESWCPRLETVEFLDHIDPRHGNWSDRLAWIEPTVSQGFGEILRLQESENKSLGAFRPKRILGIEVSPEPSEWSDAQIAAINQGDLFCQKEPLEKAPYRFRLGFLDELDKEHWLSVIDWEFFQLWRKERNRLGNESQAAESVKSKLQQVTSDENDLILFVGNLANPAMRRSFMILGCSWPKRRPVTPAPLVQGTLF